jgi:hypothetical protein
MDILIASFVRTQHRVHASKWHRWPSRLPHPRVTVQPPAVRTDHCLSETGISPAARSLPRVPRPRRPRPPTGPVRWRPLMELVSTWLWPTNSIILVAPASTASQCLVYLARLYRQPGTVHDRRLRSAAAGPHSRNRSLCDGCTHPLQYCTNQSPIYHPSLPPQHSNRGWLPYTLSVP